MAACPARGRPRRGAPRAARATPACTAAALVALGATGIALAAARGPGSQRPTAAPPGRGSPSGPPTGRRRPAGRGGSGRAGPSSAERKADLRLEGEFLQKMSEGGIGSQIEALALADSVAALRVLPPSQKRQNLGGDWRLAASDAGDLLVQFGSGLHGMPFTAVSDMWLSLRPSQKESRTTEILQMGPSKITNMLKGELSLGAVGEEEIVMEYVGMVDNNGVYKATGGSTRKVTASPLYAGERVLVLRIKPSDERKGGFAIFEREDDLARSLRSTVGEDVAVLPQLRRAPAR
ncbi:unnamed protein product [Prorocentrum cordatum]|uniref:Plastid lipid-associated protein/fibrillin conserved domain-containing protein n=1 Tax=Prorocentrum cordatum TaxID=2364126 RepID=A0ABN9TEY6_9DINO|nr:unnamed protein product [Polarella glacialis]